MTPKIARFLAEQQPATPCLVLDVDRVEENFRALRRTLPLARIYYAVKANPAPQILERLVGLSSFFDAASFEEVSACLDVGARPDAISFGNTIKKVSAIRSAHERGITLFAFDAIEELEKLAKHAPGARVYCRVLVENAGADWPLSRKFGTTVENAKALMLRAGEMGLDPYGLSFHVGSQQTTTESYELAVGKVGMLFTDLLDAGVNLRMLNLGGGFPTKYLKEVPGVKTYGQAIFRALRKHFGNRIPETIIEPGRGMVGNAGIIEAEVVLISRKSDEDKQRWVYLDVGKFNGLAETMDEMIRYPIRTAYDDDALAPCVIAGPTCDSVDVLYEKEPYLLPVSLEIGAKVLIEGTGAYTTTYSAVGFNGFAPLKSYVI